MEPLTSILLVLVVIVLLFFANFTTKRQIDQRETFPMSQFGVYSDTYRCNLSDDKSNLLLEVAYDTSSDRDVFDYYVYVKRGHAPGLRGGRISLRHKGKDEYIVFTLYEIDRPFMFLSQKKYDVVMS